MAQENWQRQMKNVSIGEASRSNASPRKRNREHWTFAVEIATEDKPRLLQAFRVELIYFANLVRLFSSRVRSNPESIIKLTEEYTNILAETACLLWPVRNILHIEKEKLTEELLPGT